MRQSMMTVCTSLLLCLPIYHVVAAEPTAEDYMNFFNYHVGDWKCEVDNGTAIPAGA